MSGAERHQLPPPPESPGPVLAVPRIEVSTVMVRRAGNEVLINCGIFRSFCGPDGAVCPTEARSVPTAELTLSIGTLKDLVLACADQLRQHEAQFGEVHTHYTKSLAEAATRAAGGKAPQ